MSDEHGVPADWVPPGYEEIAQAIYESVFERYLERLQAASDQAERRMVETWMKQEVTELLRDRIRADLEG